MNAFLEKNWRILLIVGVFLFAVYVWPTIYRYHEGFSEARLPLRENRFTGKIEFWRPGTGWSTD